MQYANHFVRDAKICGGEPVIRGTRVTLRTVLASLAEGDTITEILSAFPTLNEEKDFFELEDIESWTRCFVVVTDRKLRL